MATQCLYHHGISGQKWGKRNGPPYPLYRKTMAWKNKSIKSAKTRLAMAKRERRERIAKNEVKRTKAKKALRIIDDEFIKPEVKKALVIAGLTALGTAVVYVSLNPTVRAKSYSALQKIAGSRTDAVIDVAEKGYRYTRNIMRTQAFRTGVKVAAAVDTGLAAKRAYNRAKAEGLVGSKTKRKTGR